MKKWGRCDQMKSSSSCQQQQIVAVQKCGCNVMKVSLSLRNAKNKDFSLKFKSLIIKSWLKLIFGEGNGTPLQYSCLENPMDGGACWAAVHGVTKSWTQFSDFTFTHWRRKWQPTPVFLPGESQGRGSLVGYRLWGRTESDTTEATQQQQQQT